MADGTGIEWTDATWNPIRGCSRVSEGCRHCYAETTAARFSGPGQPYDGLVTRVTRPDGTSEARWTGKVSVVEHLLDQPLRWKRPRRIFVNSMSDLFHESVPDCDIQLIFMRMREASHHTFQVLTKRPERMRAFCLARDLPPLPNVWLGVSVEDQATADARIPLLLETPAALRFISAEPLLGPVSISQHLRWVDHEPPIGWVIVGGESGRGARPMHPDWARSLRDQCTVAGVPFFFKQWGEWAPTNSTGGHPLHAGKLHATTIAASTDRARLGKTIYQAGHGQNVPSSLLERVGKKAAGGLLDGREHKEFPA